MRETRAWELRRERPRPVTSRIPPPAYGSPHSFNHPTDPAPGSTASSPRPPITSPASPPRPQVLINPSDEPYFNILSAMSNPNDLHVLDLRDTSDDAFAAMARRLHDVVMAEGGPQVGASVWLSWLGWLVGWLGGSLE